MTMHKGDRLRHQPSSALAASEKTSYVYPEIDQIWLYDLGGFKGCKLTMVYFRRRGDIRTL